MESTGKLCPTVMTMPPSYPRFFIGYGPPAACGRTGSRLVLHQASHHVKSPCVIEQVPHRGRRRAVSEVGWIHTIGIAIPRLREICESFMSDLSGHHG